MNMKLKQLLPRIGVSAFIGLLAACSSDDNKQLSKALKEFQESCNTKVSAEFTYGTWNRAIVLRCGELKEKAFDR